MSETIAAILAALQQSEPAVLCQVVETKGSTPQKAGAIMLVDALGRQVGTLGGGCVEAEVKQKALRRLEQAGAELFTFVLDHDQAWADGLVCGGKMTILAEAIRGSDALDYFQAYSATLAQGQGAFEAVAVRDLPPHAPLGARWLLDASGRCIATYRAERSNAPAPPDNLDLTRPRPATHQGVAWLPVPRRIRLVIVGAGHVGQAVAELAAPVGFDVWVVDDRKQFANAERFPSARRIVVGPFDQVLPTLNLDQNSYVLIVTRGHGHDQEVLGLAAPTDAAYVGLIGSKRKIRMIFEALREQGLDPAALARVTAPVGLDIGSESVPEIAVSIVAQLIAMRNLGAATLRRALEPDA